MAAADAQTAWAVGLNGTIVHTADGGSTWPPQSSGTTANLYGVAAADAQTAWVVGSSGTILKTTDGGASWDPQVSGTGYGLNSVAAADPQTAWAVGEEGTILKNILGRSVWTRQSSDTTPVLYGVAAADAQTAWAVGEEAPILRTTDGGATWFLRRIAPEEPLYAVTAASPQTAWAVGEGGRILRSTDGGVIWSPQSSGDTNRLYAVTAVDAETAWAVGAEGNILHTTDGGATWSLQSGGTRTTLRSVAAANSQTAWAVGEQGAILYTNTGGWPPSSPPASTPDAPSLGNPASGTTVPALGASFTWTIPPDTTQVHLQVLPVNNDGPGVDIYWGSPVTSYFLPPPPLWYGLLPDMTYTWRVRSSPAANAVGIYDLSWSPWAEATFRTPAPSSGTISPVSPADGATLTSSAPIALQWDNVATDIFYYEVQVSGDPNFNTDPSTATSSVWQNLVHGGVTNPLNSWTTPELQPSTTYYGGCGRGCRATARRWSGRPPGASTHRRHRERSARMDCCQCQGIERMFDKKEAAGKLKRYREKGPDKTTRMLTDALKAEGVEGMTLLDIGGGVGAIVHDLLSAGVATATNADASAAYIDAATEEAQRQGHADRVTYIPGDFVHLAPLIPQADIVTLDRVICCYHDLEALVGLSAARAGRLYGLVYPRDTWWVRLGVRAMNFGLWLRRNPFRVFAHPTEAVDALGRRNGLEQRYYRKAGVWQVVVYAR